MKLPIYNNYHCGYNDNQEYNFTEYDNTNNNNNYTDNDHNSRNNYRINTQMRNYEQTSYHNRNWNRNRYGEQNNNARRAHNIYTKIKDPYKQFSDRMIRRHDYRQNYVRQRNDRRQENTYNDNRRNSYPIMNNIHLWQKNNKDFNKHISNLFELYRMKQHSKNWERTPKSIKQSIEKLFDNIKPPLPNKIVMEEISSIKEGLMLNIQETIMKHLDKQTEEIYTKLKKFNPEFRRKAGEIAKSKILNNIKHIDREWVKKELDKDIEKIGTEWDIQITHIDGEWIEFHDKMETQQEDKLNHTETQNKREKDQRSSEPKPKRKTTQKKNQEEDKTGEIQIPVSNRFNVLEGLGDVIVHKEKKTKRHIEEVSPETSPEILSKDKSLKTDKKKIEKKDKKMIRRSEERRIEELEIIEEESTETDSDIMLSDSPETNLNNKRIKDRKLLKLPGNKIQREREQNVGDAINKDIEDGESSETEIKGIGSENRNNIKRDHKHNRENNEGITEGINLTRGIGDAEFEERQKREIDQALIEIMEEEMGIEDNEDSDGKERQKPNTKTERGETIDKGTQSPEIGDYLNTIKQINRPQKRIQFEQTDIRTMIDSRTRQNIPQNLRIHLEKDKKLRRNWQIIPMSETNIIVIGDSNMRLATPPQNNWEIHCFPGANLAHVVDILKASKFPPQIKDIVITVGINHRNWDFKSSTSVEVRKILAILRDMNVRYHFAGVSTTDKLTTQEMKNIKDLNEDLQQRLRKYYIKPLPVEDTIVQHDNIHHTEETVTKIILIICQHLDFLAKQTTPKSIR